jgi:HPt (histidine-containing phosphotransfer) domain-containing protein
MCNGKNGVGGQDEPAILNLDKALARLDHDRSLFNEMAGFFLSDSPALIDTIRAAVESSGDRDETILDEAIRAAHTLKNLAGTCGGERAACSANRVEQALIALNWDAAGPLLETLVVDVEALQERLRGLAWEC